MGTKNDNIKISVRNLVEFILRSGDLDNTRTRHDVDAMQAGSRIHRKIQKQMESNYSAEVPLSLTIPITKDGVSFPLTVEGRADGIIYEEKQDDNIAVFQLEEEDAEEPAEFTIDEIKGVYFDLYQLTEPVPVHRAQAMCYAYIYANKNKISRIGIQLTYCNIESEYIRRFNETFEYDHLETWFHDLTDEYSKWAVWQIQWNEKRDQTIKSLDFPFPYRKGQKELATGVYRTILRKKKLFLEAPTGVGKTLSTVFPTIKAMGEGIVEKVFYLTAKTITRTVAQETFELLMKQGFMFKVITITAKDKMCVLDRPDCNPKACDRAKGYFDRVNDAVFDLVCNENEITREKVFDYAEKHCVCPFEMSLDVTLWADAIICDYNYVFDPNVYLRRFFANDKKRDYTFLVDEAHNLVDRAREMYSAVLQKESFLEVKNIIKDQNPKLSNQLTTCNRDLLKYKRGCDEFEILDNISDFSLHLMRLLTEYEVFLQENVMKEGKEEILQLYFDIKHFLYIFEIHDDNYTIYVNYDEQDRFQIKLQCMDPSRNLKNCMERGRSTIMFSATLLPIQYYVEQLGGNQEEDYALYAPSSFSVDQRLIMIGTDVSTKYSRRNKKEYQLIVDYIREFVGSKMGNYMVFFPSYKMMMDVAALAIEEIEGLVLQESNMTEIEKEEFLNGFQEEPESNRVAFCVMGGIFSEGIDLKRNRLIGAVIVGTGLPMVCNERELFRGYYDHRNNRGFDYAYLYQGMNKVLQSAGRVIRTGEDRGAILLLDDRFASNQYRRLFPKEWYPNVFVNRHTIRETVEQFWSKCEE